MTEQEFLSRVAKRLGRGDQARVAPPRWQPTAPRPAAGLADPDALADRFQAELERLSGHVHRATAAAEVASIITQILADAGLVGTVVRWTDPALDSLGLDAALQAAGHTVIPFAHGQSGREQVLAAEQAIAGITGVDAAVAETGTLVLGSAAIGLVGGLGRGRSVSLLPPIHIAVLRKEQIVYSSLSVFQRLASGPLPSQVIFASGPSRSADIENDLSIGVHGPGALHVIII